MLHLSPFPRAKRRTQNGPTSVIPFSERRSSFPFRKNRILCFRSLLHRQWRKSDKHYGIIFNCLVTRPCYLEACPSITSDNFLNTFRRFLARRGQPRLLRSDNGINFIGARRSLQDSFNERIRYPKDEIPQAADLQWDFNPPSAPISV